MSKIDVPEGPWVWGCPYAGSGYEPDHPWHTSLYAPAEEPNKRFVLEADSIGDGIDFEPIKNLIAAAPDLYVACETLLFELVVGPTCKEEVIANARTALAKARGEYGHPDP